MMLVNQLVLFEQWERPIPVQSLLMTALMVSVMSLLDQMM